MISGPVSCIHCRQWHPNKSQLRFHFCRPLNEPPAKEIKLHLSPEDVFAKGVAPAIVLSPRVRRCKRKREMRFIKSKLRSKLAKRARLAENHGWKPKHDFRSTDNIHL